MTRWQRVDGHLVDTMAPPIVVSRPECDPFAEPAPSPPAPGADSPAPAPTVECCERCGRPMIGVSG